MFVSHSSVRSDVKWQVVRPTIRCGRRVSVITEEASFPVSVCVRASCCVAGHGILVCVSVYECVYIRVYVRTTGLSFYSAKLKLGTTSTGTAGAFQHKSK